MASLRENREEFLDVLQQIAKNYIDANGAMCTSFILTSEWMNSEGQYYIFTITDDESPFGPCEPALLLSKSVPFV